MSNSRDINYIIRPAKGVERKMLAEICSRFGLLHPLTEYQYVGYGGAYFCDFSLFHRALNIPRMISIEHDKPGIKRYEFNKPFKCVRVESGNARDLLPDLDWTRPSVVWMDEIKELSEDLINVVGAVVRQLVSGSLIILTVAATQLSGDDRERRDQLTRRLGRFTPDLAENELAGQRLETRLFDVLCGEMQKTLDRRDAGADEAQRSQFVPMIKFGYRDNRRMNTFGGMVLTKTQKDSQLGPVVKDLAFVVNPERKETFEIEVPNLSLKEVRRLNEFLPCDDIPVSDLREEMGLVDSDILAYANIYRYYPHLSEILS